VNFQKITSDVVLENDVTIYDLTSFYGCAIGDRTNIGANVTRDMPDDSVVAGNPMRIVIRKQ
jgi:acetyltransferase-like isoleucine patch superfamily enzyme